MKSVTAETLRPAESARDRTYERVRIVAASLPQLTALPGIIWIEPTTEAEPSGEREVEIAAGLVTWQYPSILMPGTQGAYPGWLTAKGITPQNLSPVALLDTGWNYGIGTLHNDLRNTAGTSTVTAVNYTLDPVGPLNPDVDCTGHGTMVTGVLGGNPSGPFGSMVRDNGGSGYLMGLGMMPGGPVVAGRIWTFSGSTSNYLQPQAFASVYKDLWNRGVRVTNNSWNLSSVDYPSEASIFDDQVRHTGQSGAYGGPMAIVVSAGNRDSSAPTAYVATPANSKNVITVGATEGYNPSGYADVWASSGYPTGGSAADNANTLWAGSRVGPTYPYATDARIKPDLVAPGTGVESARTEYAGTCYLPGPNVGSTIDPAGPSNSRHIWSRGTSFSAPLVAGSANLLRAVHGAISPAMTKAMLIGLAAPLDSRDHAPKDGSGWGRLNLTRAFNTTYPTGYFKLDQSVVLHPGDSPYSTPSLTVLDSSRAVRIVLVWTDAPGDASLSHQLKNDLDLVVWSTDPSSYYFWSIGNAFSPVTPYLEGRSRVYGLGAVPDPWTWDRRNNVEVVVPASDLRSSFRVEVRPTGIVANAITSGYPTQQDFALFVENVR